MASIRPTIKGAGIVWLIWLQTTHGVAPGKRRMAATVPASAIVTFAGIEKVIVVENGKAMEKAVTTGRRGSDWVEIKSGVNVGQTVVVDPGNLQSGQAVTEF